MAMPIRRTKKTTDKSGPKQSVSETKRELAMQARGTGKKVGPKAQASRVAAKQYGKTIKKQELMAAKRGGTKPKTAGVKRVEASDKLKKQAAGVTIRVRRGPKKTTIDMSKKPIGKPAKYMTK